jgi:hypothetical protein
MRRLRERGQGLGDRIDDVGRSRVAARTRTRTAYIGPRCAFILRRC